MRVALYARVSTADQDPELQLREMREYASRRGWDIAKEYVDHGASGATDSRPALNDLMRNARRYGAVMVWKFDRFGRSVIHLLNSLQQFRELGVHFVSVTEQLDTGTSLGKAMFTLLAMLAEFERDIIRERVKAGIAVAQARGKHCGRPVRAVDAQEVATLKAAGMTWRQIKESTGIPRSTALRALKGVSKSVSPNGSVSA
ncbi:MAG: recombinase family protein [Candidatus Acidiferrales bacterium]